MRQFFVWSEIYALYIEIQKWIIYMMNAGQPLVRAKSLKSLAGIVEADPYCLSESEIEKAVKSRLMDMAISVREASVDLLGRFVVQQPELSNQYSSIILARIKDKGPSVRRRVIRILGDLCVLGVSN